MLTAKVKLVYTRHSQGEQKEYVVSGTAPDSLGAVLGFDGNYLHWGTVRELASLNGVRLEWDDVFLYQPLDFRGRYYTPAGWRG